MEKEQIMEYLKESKPIEVSKLCSDRFNFIIPSYQRGYRWTDKEVLQLLEDVIAYKEEKDGKFYCLQPLVVRHINNDGEDQWRVIDGQQRLTTIYLILKTLKKDEDLYSLEYDRDNILAKIFDKSQQIDKDINSEVYHLFNAKETIEKYCDSTSKVDANEINKKKDLLRTNILDHCRFILYVMKEDNHHTEEDLNVMEHELFNNLNSGKISLTESELIKALFLHHVGEDKWVKEIKQISMSEELDMMERELRKDEIWYFLAGDKPKPSSCIDLLYRVWYLSQFEDISSNIDYPIFSVMEQQMSTNSQMRQKWEEIRKCFYTITGWFDNVLLYNLIGYLQGRKIPNNKSENYPPFHERLLANLYNYASRPNNDGCLPTKKDFIRHVKELCLNSIPNNYINSRYDKDKNEVFNVLFLLNVAMMINNKSTINDPNKKKSTGNGSDVQISRFPFHVFHTVNWNVEHISPRTPKKKQELYKHLCELKKEYGDAPLPEKVENLYKKMELNEDNLENLENDSEYRKIMQDLFLDYEQVMLLDNLTLLTEHDNKGIRNGLYFDKRNRLNKYQAQGSFIPASTLNVFSKWYTKHPKETDFVFWRPEDKEAYEKAINSIIEDFKRMCQEYE